MTGDPNIKNGFPKFWIQPSIILLGLILLTWIFHHWNLDLRLQRQFYDPENGWSLGRAPFWMGLYRYGTLPGLLLTLTALVLFYLSLIRKSWKHLRTPMLVVVLTAVLGGGVLVNAILKPFWGRPRPRETIEFNGQWQYRPVHRPGIPGKGQSFPCGHCTMGFLFTTLFYLRWFSKKAAVIGGGFGIVAGFLLGAARILQGAHFATDVLWSGGIIVLTASLLHEGLIPKLSPWFEAFKRFSRLRKAILAAVIALSFTGVSTAFLTRRPVYETYYQPITLNRHTDRVIITTNVDFTRRQIRYGTAENISVTVDARGFGWTNASHDLLISRRFDATTLDIHLQAKTKGYFSELTHQLKLVLPAVSKDRIAVEIRSNPVSKGKVP